MGAGIFLGIVTSDVIIRIAGPILPGNFTSRALQERHPVYGIFHRPGASAWVHDPEFTTFVRFNAEGLRGPEISSAPATGTSRILVLGDSFVEAAEVDEAQALPAMLAKEMSTTHATEVLNAGVRGWGTAQEYLYLTREGLDLQPDVVVMVVYVGNDLVDNSRELSGFAEGSPTSRPFYSIKSGNLELSPASAPTATFWEPAMEAARGRSALFNFIESGVADKLAFADQEEVLRSTHRQVFASPPPRAWEESWRITESLVIATRHAVEAGGGRFVLVIAPHKAQLDQGEFDRLIRGSPIRGTTWSSTMPMQRLNELAGRAGIPTIDLLAAFQNVPDTHALFFTENSHWSATGHRIAAEAIAGALLGL